MNPIKLTFKYNLKIAVTIYILSMLLSGFIFGILNIKIGEFKFSNDLGTWYTIFFHNLKIHLLLIIGGVLFSIPSLIILIINGLFGGFYIVQAFILGQFDSLIKTIFLHAIFEIPTTLLSVVLSLQISFFIYYRIVKKEKFTIKLSKMLGVFLSVVLLTLIAAIIEGIR